MVFLSRIVTFYSQIIDLDNTRIYNPNSKQASFLLSIYYIDFYH